MVSRLSKHEVSSLAWLPVGSATAPDLWEAMLLACWGAEKTINYFEEPNYSEIMDHADALMSTAVVDRIAKVVWPDYRSMSMDL